MDFASTDAWQEILNHLEHIRRFWHDLVDGDLNAMGKIDSRAVQALELRAPGASTHDAEEVHAQLQAGQILSAFSEDERRYIFERLCRFSFLIPSLHTFFRDLTYWEACVESVKHLVTVSRRDTIFSTFERGFTAINQQDNRVVVQVGESHFENLQGLSDAQFDLGFRQIIIFAMRRFLEMPREPVSRDVTVRPRVKASTSALIQFAQLAMRVGFETPEIHHLLDTPERSEPSTSPTSTQPLLVTSGPGEKLKRRCGLPTLDTFLDDRDFLFLHHLHGHQDERGEGITSFFVLKSIYFAFMGRSDRMDGLWTHPSTQLVLYRDNFDVAEQYLRQQEQAQEEQAQREQERREQERREQERREQERREQERREQAQQEREKQERAKKVEQDRPEREEQMVLSERPEQVCIHFKIRQNNIWRDVQSLWVDPSDPSEVVRVAKKNTRKGLRMFDTNMHLLTPDNCFGAVTADGTNTIVLVPQRELHIDEQVLDSASVLAMVDDEGSKKAC